MPTLPKSSRTNANSPKNRVELMPNLQKPSRTNANSPKTE